LRAAARSKRLMIDPSEHALQVLEYDRIRDVLSSYCASSLGKEVVSKLRPLASPQEARRHLAQTQEMRALLKTSRLPLAGLRCIVAELEAATGQGHPAEPEFLSRVADFIQAGRWVRETIERDRSALPELFALAARIQDLPALREEISSKVDSKLGVRDEATERLASLRKSILELRSSLRARTLRILQEPRLRPAFQAEGLTIKNDRYLLPVKAEYRSWIHGPIRDRSQSGATFYIEPDEVSLEGDQLLDAIDAERNEVERVLWDLTRKVVAAKATLRALEEVLGWIDFTQAKASYADSFGLEAPRINEQGVLDLRDLRHPYLMWLARDVRRDHRDVDLEAVKSRVVPISVRLGENFKILVVTGPNTGGKTVALKTIGLNVLMALSGVPFAAAEGSQVPWYGNVFADIGDEQSIEQSLSTFSSHLTQIMAVLKHADDRSLILLDELGSGTDPLEGAALGRALLDKFLAKGWCAIITTHIGSLKEYAYSREGAENAAMEFDPRTLRPTYRLLMGIPGSSNALAIARRIGLDGEVLAAAEKEILEIQAPTREIITRMEQSRRRVEKERRRAEKVRRKVQGEARAYEERLKEVEATRDVLHLEAQRTVDEAVREAKARIEPLVDQLKNVPKTHKPIVDKLAEEVDRLLAGTPLGEKREEFARSLKKEEMVYIPKFREKAKVKKIDKGNRVLTVLLNGIPTEVGFDDISWIDEPARVPPR
jgi:DNA mismatch repair protein MutS2